MTIQRYIAVVLLIVAAWDFGLLGGVGIGATPITQATYVYEKDQSGGVPPGVQYALGEINKAGKISAAPIEVDIKDSTGSTPPQYKIAVEAAKEAGLPALIVQAGEKVVETVPDTKETPLTTEKIMEAVGHE